MSLAWVITGTIGQVILGFLLFLIPTVIGSSIVNENTLRIFAIDIFTLSIYALPLSCALSAGIVLYLFKNGASSSSYWWYVVPLILTALFVLYVSKLSN